MTPGTTNQQERPPRSNSASAPAPAAAPLHLHPDVANMPDQPLPLQQRLSLSQPMVMDTPPSPISDFWRDALPNNGLLTPEEIDEMDAGHRDPLRIPLSTSPLNPTVLTQLDPRDTSNTTNNSNSNTTSGNPFRTVGLTNQSIVPRSIPRSTMPNPYARNGPSASTMLQQPPSSTATQETSGNRRRVSFDVPGKYNISV